MKELTLSHNNTTHKQLNRPNPLQRHLTLTCSLVETQLMPQFILTDRARVVNLVSENEEGHLREFLHGEEGVELGFGFDESLVVLRVD